MCPFTSPWSSEVAPRSMKMSTPSSRKRRGSSSNDNGQKGLIGLSWVTHTVVIFLKVLVKDGVILDDVLRGRRANGCTVRIEQLRLEISFPKFCFGEL